MFNFSSSTPRRTCSAERTYVRVVPPKGECGMRTLRSNAAYRRWHVLSGHKMSMLRATCTSLLDLRSLSLVESSTYSRESRGVYPRKCTPFVLILQVLITSFSCCFARPYSFIQNAVNLIVDSISVRFKRKEAGNC